MNITIQTQPPFKTFSFFLIFIFSPSANQTNQPTKKTPQSANKTWIPFNSKLHHIKVVKMTEKYIVEEVSYSRRGFSYSSCCCCCWFFILLLLFGLGVARIIIIIIMKIQLERKKNQIINRMSDFFSFIIFPHFCQFPFVLSPLYYSQTDTHTHLLTYSFQLLVGKCSKYIR